MLDRLGLMTDNPRYNQKTNSTEPCCYLFDFGNVIGLFDFKIAFRNILSLAKSSQRLDEVERAVFANGLFQAFERGEIDSDVFLGTVQKRLGISIPMVEMARAWVEIMRPNDDVISILPGLKGNSSRLVLGSNNNELHYEKAWSEFGEVLSLFDAHIFSHQIGAVKPDAAFFDVCVEACGCAPGKILYVDDLEANILAGREFGFLTLQYRPDTSIREELAEMGIRIEKPA